MTSIDHQEPFHLVQDALQRYGSQIKNTKRDSYLAQCPAHKDADPSLSVTRGDDGRVLLHCFAGCEPETICGVLGISMADLFVRDTRQPNTVASHLYEPKRAEMQRTPFPFNVRQEGNRTVYEYVDGDGQIAYENERRPKPDGGKSFLAYSYDSAGNRVSGLKGRRQIPYGLPELLQTQPGSVVHVTEGEKDTITLRKNGLLAVSLSEGALRNSNNAVWFRSFHILIHADNDDAGRKKAAKKAEALFPYAASVRIVEYPELPEKGDVTDWLEGSNAGN